MTKGVRALPAARSDSGHLQTSADDTVKNRPAFICLIGRPDLQKYLSTLALRSGLFQIAQYCFTRFAQQGQFGNRARLRVPHAKDLFLPVNVLQTQRDDFAGSQAVSEVGALSRAEKEQLQRRGEGALGDLAQRQAQYQAGSDPAWRFVALVQAALAGGRVPVADRQGKVPTAAAAWGWQRRGPGRGWEARGTRIGWVAGGDLYLEPTASYEVARTVAGTARLSVSEQTLRQRLREQGLLASIDAGRQMLQVRRTLGGQPRQVLHLRTSDVLLPTE